MFTILPLWYELALVFVLGIIVGSFLNVYIYRFNTGRSLSGRSHCLSCGTPLRSYELLPLVSYLALRARCGHCGSFIPPRYFFVELTAGLLFLTTYLTLPDLVSIVLTWCFVAVLVVIVVYDINHLIIPNPLVAVSLGIALVLQIYELALTGDAFGVLYDLCAAAAVAAFFFALWFVSRGRWLGFGDVKLVFPLALVAGFEQAFSFVVFSFWIGAVVSLALLALQRLRARGQRSLRLQGRTLTMKSEVPFGPFLVAGFIATYLFSLDAVSLIYHAMV